MNSRNRRIEYHDDMSDNYHDKKMKFHDRQLHPLYHLAKLSSELHATASDAWKGKWEDPKRYSLAARRASEAYKAASRHLQKNDLY